MTSQTADYKANLKDLRANYKGAFEEWALQVGHLQTVKQSGSSLAIEEAEERVSTAEAAYLHTRNRLAKRMISARSEFALRRLVGIGGGWPH